MIVTLAHVYGPPPTGGSWFDADDAVILTALAVLAEQAEQAEGA